MPTIPPILPAMSLPILSPLYSPPPLLLKIGRRGGGKRPAKSAYSPRRCSLEERKECTRSLEHKSEQEAHLLDMGAKRYYQNSYACACTCVCLCLTCQAYLLCLPHLLSTAQCVADVCTNTVLLETRHCVTQTHLLSLPSRTA